MHAHCHLDRWLLFAIFRWIHQLSLKSCVGRKAGGLSKVVCLACVFASLRLRSGYLGLKRAFG